MKNALPVKIYQLLIWLASHLQSVFLLAVRVTWGWQFFLTGKGKLTHLDKTAEFFSSLNIPAPKLNAIVAGSTECFGGLLLLLGLGARFWAAGLTVVMIVAYATADRDSLHSLDDFVKANPFPFLFAVLVVFCFGPGRFSIDYLLQRFVFKKTNDPLAGFEVLPGRRAHA